MKNRYKKAFDVISPIRSDEELLRAVLDRKAENMKTTRKIGKKAVAILVAAVLLGATAVGVGAAYQWNLSAAFEGLFRDRSETFGGKSDSGIDFSRIGTEIGESWHGEGYTLTIEGAVANESNIYFYYTLAFDEDFPYDHAPRKADGTEQENWLVDNRTLSLESNGESLAYKVNIQVLKDEVRWIDEKTLQGAFKFSSYEYEDHLTNRELTLKIKMISRIKFDEDGMPDWDEAECGLSLDLFFDGNSAYESVTVTPNLPMENGTLTALTISMFSVDYTVLGKSDSFEGVPLYPSSFRVTLRDGTDVKTSGGSAVGYSKEGSVHVDFVSPIDPAEVASVQIEETVIDLTDR